MHEINFDGLVGPSHNYAGLSYGNVASATNAGQISSPRRAALQGVAKMREMLALGLKQGFLLPHERPFPQWLRKLGFSGSDDEVLAAAWRNEPILLANTFSASAMWTANAATVSPSPDTADGRCHLTVANLSSMLHRSIEAEQTLQQLKLAFNDSRLFAVHDPLPAKIGDEGAANAMRLCRGHGDPGLEIFVYGDNRDGRFPARQNPIAGEAIARRHGLARERQLHVQQSRAAINAGAFHNDVVAVANESVLFTHEFAFEERGRVHQAIRDRIDDLEIIEAPASRIPLGDAVRSYLFNSQLITLRPGGMILVIPRECRETPSVWSWLNDAVVGHSSIGQLKVVDVRESMRNGGGPACLRLRIPLSDEAFAKVDPRFLASDAQCDRLERVIEQHWPQQIAAADLSDPELWATCRGARAALLETLGFHAGEI